MFVKVLKLENMEIISNFGSKKIIFPPIIYNTVKIADAVSKEGENFSIFAGWDKKMVEQLKNLSSDKKNVELQNNTSDFIRFSEGSYEQWYKKRRTPFALIHNNTNALAGVAWFGPKLLGRKSIKHLNEKELKENEISLNNDNWHTISYRCYPNFRGKGLTKKFVAFVMDVYLKNVPHVKLWAGINTENIASEKLAEGLGFKRFDKLSDDNSHHIVMVKY